MEKVKIDPDFTTCSVCGCDEALILGVGVAKNLGKIKMFCPVCQKTRVKKEDETFEKA